MIVAFIIITPGVWSSPVINGDRPPPCSAFTFTKIDQHRAVLFGGVVHGYDTLNDVYILDFRNKVRDKYVRYLWTCILFVMYVQ